MSAETDPNLPPTPSPTLDLQTFMCGAFSGTIEVFPVKVPNGETTEVRPWRRRFASFPVPKLLTGTAGRGGSFIRPVWGSS